MRALVPLATFALLAGCATTPGTDRLAERDPLQGFNRVMWGFNQGVDKVVLKPVSGVYRTVTPRPARRGLSRILSNLSEPWSAINNLLQGKPDRAFTNLGRFVVNTTIGVGGLADHATKMGLKDSPEDFGQTLARWGVNGGPYLVLPILGPSTLRDGVGMGLAQFGDPYRVCLRQCGLTNTQQLAAQGAEIVSLRSDLTDSGADGLLAGSLDSYATVKSAYLQRRRAAILDQDGDAAAIPPAGPGDAAGGAGSDASLDAAVADIKAQQAEEASQPGEAAPGAPITGAPTTPPQVSPDK
ncbi:VacJ family lipoprotein [Sphingomonas solaris]|uniref:VacJ family lipoprotein n=1 Tax=Alterirhizorhabdus solaris TaxID=2529389 RepID=A0A558QVY8_9SPHN|nr:VacJ family lipoprotein [Sphingomonas solaris]TVV71237.1 VacJ family lipoprotein [Sphingomonas solaris]